MIKISKKYYLFGLLIVFIVSMGMVSAANETDVVAVSADDAMSEIPTTNVDPSHTDTKFVVEKAFSRNATDYYAGERGGNFSAILQDANGKPLAGKNVQIAVNGPIYNVTTTAAGEATIPINLMNANIYTYALTFSGDDQYNAAPIASSKLTVVAKATTITAKDISFKAKVKTKTVSVKFTTIKNPYDGKVYMKEGKSLKLKVNGKTYTAKVSKGVAKFKITKLTKKGKYTAKITFAGDKTYAASKKSIKITVK